MAEEKATLQERVSRTASETLDAVYQTLGDGLRSEPVDQLIVVNLTRDFLNSDDEVIFRGRGRLRRGGHCGVYWAVRYCYPVSSSASSWLTPSNCLEGDHSQLTVTVSLHFRSWYDF